MRSLAGINYLIGIVSAQTTFYLPKRELELETPPRVIDN